MEVNEKLRKLIFETIENQIQINDPPETKLTYNRMMELGYDDFTTKQFIGQCFAVELFEIMKHKKPYDRERYIRHFNIEEMENIIRWLERIYYKFQILNMRRLFIASKEDGYIPYLADFPLSVIRPNVAGPSKVCTEIRRSLKRVTIKNKDRNLNSLIILKLQTRAFIFFTQLATLYLLNYQDINWHSFIFIKGLSRQQKELLKKQ